MCGVIGVVSQRDVASVIYECLTVLQHRGQDAAGIATCKNRTIALVKDNGLVRDIFNSENVKKLHGNMGIGHTRYPTAGGDNRLEAQPFYVNSPYGIVLAHNGNLVNTKQLRKELFEQDRRHINTGSDSEVLLNVFAHELQKCNEPALKAPMIFDAITALNKRCIGGFAVVAMIPGHGIIGFRDPNGIRPLVLGRKLVKQQYEYMLASESVALDIHGYELVSDVAPGEAVLIGTDNKLHRQQCSEIKQHTPCIFEFVYFSREDSIMDNISVHKARLRMGETLADKILKEIPNHGIDVVIPIPDTARTSAIPLAYRLGVKFREGFVKNRYIGRTFIMPGQAAREKSVKRKLNAIDLEFRDKTVLLVDDSIVRGTTSTQIIQMAREAGAKKVYFASAAPPVRYPNVYGIDMPASKELVAYNRTEAEITKVLGADIVIYQTLDDLIAACSGGNKNIKNFDTSCFSNEYVTQIDASYLQYIEVIRSDKAKQNSA
ncbi:Amidophosphoribosyltransferase [hydrothermal vent metagenome]|uniref:amidophosphoribosyltransferase n=1 Tax=hydrothermal vent metagenome TaxID=652676 RepID=A0A3B0UQ47_9ZZZZ